MDNRRAIEFSQYLLSEGDVIIGMDRTFTKSGSKITRISLKDLPCLLVQRVGRDVDSLSNHQICNRLRGTHGDSDFYVNGVLTVLGRNTTEEIE